MGGTVAQIHLEDLRAQAEMLETRADAARGVERDALQRLAGRVRTRIAELAEVPSA